MNILERKAYINGYYSLLDLFDKQPVVNNDISEYLRNFVKPPLRYYIPEHVLITLYNISCDSKLANNPKKRFEVQNNLLESYGFRPLASGTSRRTFYCVYDPQIIIKLGSDMIGRSDNLSEFILQRVLSPFCPKIFDVDQTGSVMLSERVETMTENDYKKWIKEIFAFVESYFQLGYIFEDIGLYSFKNWGLRLGFGPVLLDFPYLYQIDWNKMVCDRIDPITHKKCSGQIGYNYESVMSEIICHKCNVRYSAQYLAKPITGKMMENILLGRKSKMLKPHTIKVVVAKGNQIIFDPNAPETVLPKPTITTNPQPKQQQTPQNNMGPTYSTPQYVTPQQPFTPTTLPMDQQILYVVQKNKRKDLEIENVKKDIELRHYQNILNNMNAPQPADNNAFYPSPFKSPIDFAANMFGASSRPDYNASYQQPPVQQSKPEVTVDTAKDYEYYTKDDKKYIFYPKPLKNDIIQFIKKTETNHGIEAAMFIAKHLEIEYIPQAQWNSTKKSEVAVQKPFPTTPSQAPVSQSPVTPTDSQTIYMVNKPTPVQTVIAPPTTPMQLKVENPTYWAGLKFNIPSTDTVVSNEEHPTSGLEILAPMTPEQIEAQDLKNRQEQGVMGYPGIPVVETTRAKEAIPRIKAMVEQRFSNFVLDNDAEQQAFILSQNILKFIEEDMKYIMNDDGKGLVVTARRTVDNHNKDCFNIRVLNYGSFIFSAVLYPKQNVQQNQPVINTQLKDDISVDELTKFFEDTIKKFDSSKYNDIDTIRKGLIEFLYNAAANTFKGKLTVPRAMKEATAYVNQVVNFQVVNSSDSNIAISDNPVNPIANAL